MSDFGIQIKIDPGDAKPEIKSLQDVVSALETSGKNAGTAIAVGVREGGTAARDAQGRFVGLGKSVADAKNEAEQFELMVTAGNRALAAEAEMLDRINGPLDKYNTGLAALDSLMEKGKINAEQYAEQVIKLNTALEKTQAIKETNVKFGPDASQRGTPAGPTYGPDRNQAGPSGDGEGGSDMFGGTAAMVAGLATIATVKKVGAELIDLSDRYIEMSNAALRLTDATHNVNDVLYQQIGFSQQLHGTMQQTINLTAMVRAGTQELNYTTGEQNELVRDIAEKIQLAGHTMDDAAGIVKKLQYAFEEGIVPGRTLKGIFEEYPNVSKTMQAELGVSEARLTSLGKQGKITGEMLRDGFRISEPEQAQFDLRQETSSEKVEHLKDQIALGAHGMGDWLVSLASTEGPLEKLSEYALGASGSLKAMQERIADDKYWNAFDAYVEEAVQQSEKLGKSLDSVHMSPGVQAIFDAYEHKDDGIKNLTAAIKINEDEQIKAAGVEAEIIPLMAQHTKFVRDLEAATRSHTGVLKTHHIAMTEEQKVYESINKPLREHYEGLAAVAAIHKSVEAAFANGTMDATHYAVAISELAKAHEHYYAIIGEKDAGSNSSVADSSSRLVAKLGGDKLQQTGSGLNLDALAPQDSDAKDALGIEKMKQAEALYATLRSSAQKYTDEVKKIGESDLDIPLQAKLLENLKEKYFDVLDPEKKHADGLAQLTAMGNAAGLTVSQLAQVEDDYRKKTGMARDATQGFGDGLKDIEKSLGNGGALAATKLLTDGFNTMNSALTELITTGTTDWGKFLKSIETDAVSFGLKDLEGGLFSALKGGSAGAGSSTAATSTTALATAAGAAVAPIDTLAASIASLSTAASAAGAGSAGIPGIGIAGGAAPAAGAGYGADAAAPSVTSITGWSTDSYRVPGGGSGGAPTGRAPVVNINVQNDQREMLKGLGSRDGARAQTQHVIKNARAYRSLLGRR